MARTTAGKLASKTAAAAKNLTATVAKKATPPAQRTPDEPTTPRNANSSGGKPAGTKPSTTSPEAESTPAVQKAPTAAKKGSPAAKQAAKTAASKTATSKKAATKKAATKKAAAKSAASRSGTAKAAARKSATKAASGGRAPGPGRTGDARSSAAPSADGQSPRVLPIKPGEDPWSSAELEEVRAELTADVVRLRGELELATRELDDFMRDAGDGAGNDQADVGYTTFERDHELSLTNHARDMLLQTEHALARIADRSYGVCESCGQPIGKNRLMAFPRATLCLTCKQREERR